jgi:hypothetical protein
MRIGVLTEVNTKVSGAWHLVVLHVGTTVFKELAKSIFRVEGLKVAAADLSKTFIFYRITWVYIQEDYNNIKANYFKKTIGNIFNRYGRQL